ncbi:DUF159 domain protein [Pseudohyphozyma bogoriensis]|nr:DUF159 domain protein [Pseudohyphozyma bogoriensis]
MCGRFALGVEADDIAMMVQQQYFRGGRQQRANNNGGSAEPDDDDDDDDDAAGGADEESEREEPVASGSGTRSGDGELSESGGSNEVRWESDASKEAFRPRWNVAPQSNAVVLRAAPDGNGYILSTMKWGLISSWNKRPPTQTLNTINCADHSLFSGTGMWAGIRGRQRCVVIAQGFYEWLDKGKGSAKLPHFTKPGDGNLLMMAGLWDSVTYVGETEALQTFTIITTDSNTQLKFLHNRMPALLLDHSSLESWLAPSPDGWNSKLESLVRPYPVKDGLDCYPVPLEVGSVSNNSSDFIKPIDQRKGNIMSFFKSQGDKSSPAKPPPSKLSSTSTFPSTSTSSSKASRTASKSKSPSTQASPPVKSETKSNDVKAESGAKGKKRALKDEEEDKGRSSSVEIIEEEEKPAVKKPKSDIKRSLKKLSKERKKKTGEKEEKEVDEKGNIVLTSFFKKSDG